MTDRELMQQALEALEKHAMQRTYAGGVYIANVAIALRERLAQPEQDPVCAHGIGKTKCSFCHQPQPEQEPVAHTLNCVCGAVWDVSPDGVEEMVHAPNPPQRKPLTHPQIHEFDWPDGVSFEDILLFVRAIEAAHDIKGQE